VHLTSEGAYLSVRHSQ